MIVRFDNIKKFFVGMFFGINRNRIRRIIYKDHLFRSEEGIINSFKNGHGGN